MLNRHIAAVLLALGLLVSWIATDALAQAPPQSAPAPIEPAKPSTEPAKPPVAPAKPAPAADDTRSKLDAAEGALKQIDTTLTEKQLNTNDLAALRARIDPIGDMLGNLVSKLAPHLEALKARLEQFGPVPAEKTKADTEPPATVEGRKVAQKAFDEAAATFRRTQVLDDQASRLERTIGAKRRAIFTHALFERAPSLLAPSLWAQVATEWPGDLENMRYLIVDSVDTAVSRLTTFEAVILGSLVALVAVLYLPARRFTHRFLTRNRDAVDVPRLTKVLAAIRIALATAVVPVVAVGALVAAARAFDLLDPRIQPVVSAIFEGVGRVALAIGIARAVLAPTRPTWRLFDLSDEVAKRLRGMVVVVVVVNSLFKIFEALNDGVAASLSSAVATRAIGVLLTGLVAAVTLGRIERVRASSSGEAMAVAEPAGAYGDPATVHTDGAPEELGRHWWGLLNVVAWAVVITVLVATVSGFVAFAAFTVDQIIGAAAIAAILYALLVLADDGIPTVLSPSVTVGRMVLTGVGMRREALGQISVLTSGGLRVLFIAAAILLVLAPWGLQSDDLLGYLRTAFFGFTVGGLTVSPATIAIAAILFFLALLASRGVRNWLETKYLPQTHLGSGLQNSILTSLGYVGFVVAAALALSYVGLSFEKFAIIAGALSVGIGFGLQAIVSNFVCGLIILWERTIQVGDWVAIGDEQGYVRRINVRSTEIETMDRAVLILPNTNLVTGAVKNWVRGGKVGRIKLQIDVTHDADPDRVRDLLLHCARDHERVMASPPPAALLTGFIEKAMRFELFAHIDDIEKGGRAKSDIYLAIVRGLREAGVTIH